MSVSSDLDHIVPTLRAWLTDKALPLWANTGWDYDRGGFYEKLTPAGTPDVNAIRRLRVQARQIYVYAHAGKLGLYPDGVKVAMRGFDYLMDKGHSPDGSPGFVHLLTPDGSIANPLRDSYDHMFVLLALSWLAYASGDAQVRSTLDHVLAFVDEALTDKDGLLLEGKPTTLPRRQNPNMHGFETMLAMHTTIRHPDAMRRANLFRDCFMERFLDPATATVREFFNEDWKPLPPPRGASVEPGHMVEWTWLLRQYETITGQPASALPSKLLHSALLTADPQSGRLFDETDASGAVLQTTSRTWPHTEVAKAWLAETEIGRPDARQEALKALALLKRDYIDPAYPGGWIDQLDREGHVISDHIPASTFYHIFVAIAEADRVLGKKPV